MRKSSDAEYSDTNGYFWHRHHFLLARSATNLTLAFVKMLYECDGLSTALSLGRLAAERDRLEFWIMVLAYLQRLTKGGGRSRNALLSSIW